MAAALTCGMVSIAVSPAQANDTLPDGGGWAHAGAHDSAQARSGVTAQAATPAGYSVYGIDVSSHDHSSFPINWQGVANSGIKFAYVKATEGPNYTNPYFATDNRDSKAAGILTGAYSYGRPDKGDPVGDANYFIDNAAWTNDSRTLVPFLDIEWPWFPGTTICYNLSQQGMADWIQRFLDQIQVRIGRKAMIYTNPNWWNSCVGNARNFGAYPLDTSNYNSSVSPGALPNGWTNWTVWQYAAGTNNQQGNYDKNVFNGDYESLKRLAGIDPPPPLTSSPAVSYHPGARRFDMLASAGGALVDRSWDPNINWSGWSNFGGGVAGTPAVIYNPRYGTTEVYANVGGRVVQKYRASGWSGWGDLGGNIIGEPTVIYNPRFGTTEVYVRGVDNHVYQKFWSNGWSGWNDLSGGISGDPTVIYNPRFGSTEIYVRGVDDHVYQKTWSNGWSGWNDLSGVVAGDPAVIYNPRYGSTEIYVRAANNRLYQKYWASNWSGWMDLGGDVAGDPKVIYNASYATSEIYARGSGAQVVAKYWGNGWSGWLDLGGVIVGDPAPVYNPLNANTNIYVNGRGYLYEMVWDHRTGGFYGWNNVT